MLALKDIETIIAVLKTYFSARTDVELAVVFGSRARGDAKETSDLDVGVLYAASPDLMTIGHDVSEIEHLTGIQTDLVVLNGLATKKPEFAYNLAKDMHMLYASDPALFPEFRNRCFLSYFDFLPVLEQSRRQMQDRIANGTWGKPVYAKQK